MRASVIKSTNRVDFYESYQVRRAWASFPTGSLPGYVHEDKEVLEDEALAYEQKP